jgi:hypothetical protein
MPESVPLLALRTMLCYLSSRRLFMNKKPARKQTPPRKPRRKEILDALGKENDRQLLELIRRRLALPIEQRTNFLRKRLPGGGSCL